MPCTSPTCTMCDHPSPSSPALISLENSLLSLTSSALRAFPPLAPKSTETKQLKAALKAVSSLSASAGERHLLPFTSSTALSFLRTFDTLVLPLLEARHAAILREAERWEEMMPSVVGKATLPGEMGYEEVWAMKRKRWGRELTMLGEVGEKWEEMAAFLREVARRGMKDEEEEAAVLPLGKQVDGVSLARGGGLQGTPTM